MRGLDSARDSWTVLKSFHSIEQLKDTVRADSHASPCTNGLRSACWKSFLLFDSVEVSSWPRILTASRSAYDSLRMHFLQYLEGSHKVERSIDPLSDEVDSPWVAIRKDEDARAEIQQDVDRCMPDNPYFRQPDTKRILLDILFIYSKLNPDIAYRQGMHELLAPILWVVESDAINLGQSSKALGEDAIIRNVFDAEYIEHDTFALFGQVMQSAKNFYEQTTHTAAENPMVVRSRRIVFDLLLQADPELAQHLEQIDVVPQVFLMRWIRLLFGREFAFDDMLTVWDVIFAVDPSLDLVDHICVVMLLRIRWQLLEADYNEALSVLLRYPTPDENFAPQTLALDAIYLRDHMHIDGGSYLVLKYTGRPPQRPGRPSTPPALQRNITAFSGINATKAASLGLNSTSPTRRSRQPSNFEAILQSTAKNIYSRGEQLGIGKAVRNAVDEMHRKAQDIRDSHSPSPSTNRRSAPRLVRGLTATVRELEQRNQQLSKLLDGAVTELWDFHKLVADSTGSATPTKGEDKASLERLSMAVAKVQLVQVYLRDASLPLQEDEVEHDDSASREVQQLDPIERSISSTVSPSKIVIPKVLANPKSTLEDAGTSQVEGLADPSFFDETEDVGDTKTKTDNTSDGIETPLPSHFRPVTPVGATPSSQGLTPVATRPSLAESPYSFILGQSERAHDIDPTSYNEHQKQDRGFLFGDSSGGDGQEVVLSPPRGSNRSKKKSGAIKAVPSEAFEL